MRSSDPGIHARYVAERPGSAGLWTGSGMALQNLLIAYILNQEPNRARNYLQQCGEDGITNNQTDRVLEVSTILSRP
ncbi:MAG: hypothetical protein ACYCOU_14700 [Sulfobacillus sp.]